MQKNRTVVRFSAIKRLTLIPYGGEGGIRTLAGVAPTNGLANRPLTASWVLLPAPRFAHCIKKQKEVKHSDVVATRF